MSKTSIIILIILLTIIVASMVYFLIKKKKETKEQENTAEKKNDTLEESKTEILSTENITDVENRSCINQTETEPFAADEDIKIDPTQSRTTEEYVQWQKENTENIESNDIK